jgi:hypothetical protein
MIIQYEHCSTYHSNMATSRFTWFAIYIQLL